ncbi:BTB/POZ domain-containing protein KCTD2-like [Saccostrea cucullata]|uniref:BTB/POZ domain-containing protein KCTD2-like n=1 Tax=Saccostrea cuccullata TaxID=36930 RepID=UPI002ED212A7
MPSRSRTRSRSPLVSSVSKEYDEISIEADDQFDKEEDELSVIKQMEQMQKNMVQLDVGGYKFKTTKETITSIPSKLAKLMQIKSSNGIIPSYFLDKDPKHLGIILNYLRNNGRIDARILPDESSGLAGIMEECKFYGLVELESVVKKRLDMCRCRHVME